MAQKLLAAGTFQLGDTYLQVVPPPTPAAPENDDRDARKVLVSGISRTMSTTLLRDFLESARVNGGPIEDLIHEHGQETATVVFQHVEGKFFCFLNCELFHHVNKCERKQ